jgi:hypothetical protein
MRGIVGEERRGEVRKQMDVPLHCSISSWALDTLPNDTTPQKGLISRLMTFFSHYSTSLMSAVTKPEKAIWNNAKTTAFINYIAVHKLEAGDRANFKTSIFGCSALTVLGPLQTAGPEKTVKMCKEKWQSVSDK